MNDKFPITFQISAVDQASAEIKKVTDQFSAVTGSVDKVNQHLSLTQEKLGSLSTILENSAKGLKSFGSKMSLVVTAPIMAFGALTLKAAANFEAGMNKVRALTGSDNLEELTKQAKELGLTTQYSASQASEAMALLAMAGFDAKKIFAAMPDTLMLASAAEMNLADTADIVANVLTGYRLKVENLNEVVDIMVQGINASTMDLPDFAEAMKLAGPIASALNIEFKETVAIIGALGNAGYKGSIAGTALAGGLARLIHPVRQVRLALSELKIDPDKLKDVNDSIPSLIKVIELLEKKHAKTSHIIRIFGLEAGKAFVALMGQGSKGILELEAQLDHAKGAAKKLSDVYRQGASGAMRAFKASLEGLEIAIGESGLLQWFTAITTKLSMFIRYLSKTNPKLMKTATIIAIIAMAIGPLLLTLGQLAIITSSLITIISAVQAIGVAALALIALKAALVVTAIGGIIYAGWYLYKNWAQVSGKLNELWQQHQNKIMAVVALLLPGGSLIAGIWLIHKHWKQIIDSMTSMWNFFVKGIPEFVAKKLGIKPIEAKVEVLSPDVKSYLQSPPSKAECKAPPLLMGSSPRSLDDKMDPPETAIQKILEEANSVFKSSQESNLQKSVLEQVSKKSVDIFSTETKTKTISEAARMNEPTKKEIALTVNFENMPRGVRVSAKNPDRIPLNLNLGYLMGEMS